MISITIHGTPFCLTTRSIMGHRSDSRGQQKSGCAYVGGHVRSVVR